MDRTLSALFDDRTDAVSAADDLVAAGIARENISVVSEAEPPDTGAPGAAYGTPSGEWGFRATLADLFMPEEDVATYREGVSRGGATLIARMDDGLVDRAIDILETHNAVDLAERAQGHSAPAATELTAKSGRVRVHPHGVSEPVSENIRPHDRGRRGG